MIKDDSVVHRIHLDTVCGEAPNFSASAEALTAAGIQARMSRTENNTPSTRSSQSASRAIKGDNSSRIIMPERNARLEPDFIGTPATLTICAPRIASTTGEYAAAAIVMPCATPPGIVNPVTLSKIAAMAAYMDGKVNTDFKACFMEKLERAAK
ncbi:hypothetical protein D3C77_623020 [compost metagenome]